ncbi:chromatin assembly factor 1 subunit A-domain-containing protein [Pyronema domesticum]|nr:chromatin assembly factor 1 subunit A-domain-containing protein [Pyronema domesticum]
MAQATMTLPPPTPPGDAINNNNSASNGAVKASSPMEIDTPKKRGREEGEAAAQQDTAGANKPVKKRTKVSEAEKEEKRKEREAKEEEKKKLLEAKEEEKRQKEEEKRKAQEAKDKEKEAKEKEKEAKEKEKEAKKAEREEKKRVKDEEKRKKDEEKRKKEEEKAKKERSQFKLDMFLRNPSTPKKDPVAAAASTDTPSIASPSVSSPFAATKDPKKPTAPPSATKPLASIFQNRPSKTKGYDDYFLPFYVKKDMVVAPTHSFERDEEARLAICRAMDEALSLPHGPSNGDEMEMDGPAPVRGGLTKEEIVELLHIPPHKARARRGRILQYSTKDVLSRIENPDDPAFPPLITGRKPPTSYNSRYYLDLLNKLPHKFLKFAEDVRPPYSGTYSRVPTSSGLRKGRNPFDRALPDTNYDYDSEAEWVADEDGEELLSEDEDDKESDGEDSLDGFLDDEEDDGLKRAGMAILVPTNTGMCWEDANGKTIRADLEDMRIGLLLDNITGPIDPFSTKYWDPVPTTTQPMTGIKTAMDPPPRPATITPFTRPGNGGAAAAKPVNKDKLVPPELMEDFKRAIDGSDMTKAGLIEVLKKHFPKIGKDHIKNTLDLVAERVGDKRDEKRWVLK